MTTQLGVEILSTTLFRVFSPGPRRLFMSRDSPSPPSSPSDTESPSVRYREAVDRFVAFWGSMASTWGINRAMAQVYALLYCVERPLNTDEIMERLQMSRGSANMNLRALVEWNLVEKTKVADSRKDYFRAEKDVWQVTARIIEERERREVRPVREHLQAVADHLVPEGQQLKECPPPDRRLHERLENLIELISVFEGVSEALLPLVKNRNERIIRRLIALARSLGAEDSCETEETPPSPET